MPVLYKVMHGHQFERRHAQFLQVLDDWLGGHAGISAAQVLRHPWMQLGHAAYMSLVNQGFVRRIRWTPLAAPIEGGIDYGAQRGEWPAIAIVKRQIRTLVAQLIAKQFVGPLQLPPDR